MSAIIETPLLGQVGTVCVTCARQVRGFTGRYRAFLLAPSTLFTSASLALLILAAVLNPGGLAGRGGPSEAQSPFYLAAALVGSVYIWWSALRGIRNRDFTADIPVSVATAAALLVHQYSAAAVVAVLLLVGGMLEQAVAARASRALDALSRLLPSRVTVRRHGLDLVVPLEEVVVGDLVLVRSGERIAVDGEIASGAACVDQAAVTGESVPVDRGPGDSVFAGTLNQAGALEIRTARVGEETALGQIRRMVAEAQLTKAPIERLLDRYARLYTPAALLLGLGLWFITHDVLRAITMLIVFCPCVMVLATPTALVASIGNAALRGSLVKMGSTIEALARVDIVCFDKTGTVTFGQPRLVEAIPLNGLPTAEMLRLCGVAEKFSEHSVGRAVVAAAEATGLKTPDPTGFEAMTGLGVRAGVGGSQVLVGRLALLARDGITISRSVERLAAELAAPGRTVIGAALDQEMAGLLVLEDEIRQESAAAIRRLRDMGLRTVLVTGDNQRTADRIAQELGIEDVHAEVLPAGKVEIVKRLQAQGHRVAFVGDGINDGPALAAADVGIAMGRGGTDLAIEAAQIGLLSDDLARLPHLFTVSRQAIRAIKQNLVFSLGVLAVAVGLTVPGILTPVSGALVHELSSIPVIANSARLIGVRVR